MSLNSRRESNKEEEEGSAGPSKKVQGFLANKDTHCPRVLQYKGTSLIRTLGSRVIKKRRRRRRSRRGTGSGLRGQVLVRRRFEAHSLLRRRPAGLLLPPAGLLRRRERLGRRLRRARI